MNLYLPSTMKGENPCKNCHQRTPTCHGVCEDYLEWKRANDKTNKKIRRKQYLDHIGQSRRIVCRARIWCGCG